MTESFRQSLGRKVVSRATAHQVGTVSHLLVTADCHQVLAVIVGKGKKASLIDWSHLSGFGADAVMVNDEAALRSPTDSRELAAAAGRLELLGRRILTESGNELGTVDDVTFDSDSGSVTTVNLVDRQIPASAVLGSGSYAVVVDATQDPV